jgi:hypothetical protein
MIFDVVDLTDPMLKQTQADLKALGRSTILTYYKLSNGVGQMVEDLCRQLGKPPAIEKFDPFAPAPRTAAEMIKTYAGAPNRIEALRIWGHGDIGMQNISAGMNGHALKYNRTGLSMDAVWENETTLRRLKGRFSPGGRAELRGCATGRGADGVAFMKKLAEVWNAKVYAAVELQPGTGLDWFGPVYEVTPGGRALLTSGPKI